MLTENQIHVLSQCPGNKETPLGKVILIGRFYTISQEEADKIINELQKKGYIKLKRSLIKRTFFVKRTKRGEELLNKLLPNES